MSLYDNSTKQLTLDEGKKRTVYHDHLGFATIGVGRLVDDRKPGAGLRDSEMAFMLQNDINDRISALAIAYPWFMRLDEARQGVLLNMSFQLGMTGLAGFRNTMELIRSGFYDKAADAMLLSKWAAQTPERAKRMSDQMRTGVWQYAE